MTYNHILSTQHLHASLSILLPHETESDLNLFPGDAAQRFTAAPPTCPCDTIAFECNAGGELDGVTLWRVGGGGGSCSLFHSHSTSTSNCGPGNVFTAMFANTSASYASTLSGTATPELDGTRISCHGPTFPGTEVGSSTIQIVG